MKFVMRYYQSIGVILTIRTLLILLMSFGLFTNTSILQDDNQKTINVLGASYSAEQNENSIDELQKDLTSASMQLSQSLQAQISSQIQQQTAAAATPAATAAATTSTKTTAKTTSTPKSTTTTAQANSNASYYVKKYKITHYCSCSKCNPGNAGVTASGKKLQLGMVAMLGVPFGTIVEINGKKYVVEDRCASSAIIDVYVSSHSEALQKGTYYAQVKIYR